MSFRAEFNVAIDLLDLHRAAPDEFPFLLQSVAGHAHSGRYDLLLGHPRETLVAGPDQNFFNEFSKALRSMQQTREDDLPFQGGWFFMLGYEAARFVEPGLALPASPYGLPDAWAVRCTAAFIYDRVEQRCHLVAEEGQAQLLGLQKLLKNNIKYSHQYYDYKGNIKIIEEPDARFINSVSRVRQYLYAGDAYQVNLSRRWDAYPAVRVDYCDLYTRLRRHNPAPFAGLAVWRDAAVLSSSPERLLKIQNGWAETRPIAGTRPRSSDPVADAALLDQLRGNLKERAEHVMLIDLERNDLGRFCKQGSIEVNELMGLETYAHVHHIVSNVKGHLRTDIDSAQALGAVFPGGTITGCPKLRAMEIIAELEQEGRGPYTGSMGYVSRCGHMDSNILIRTLLCEKERISFRTGAGIVADSMPEAELAETRAKAKGLLLALGHDA